MLRMFLCLLAILLVAALANAQPLTWTVSGAFDDGGTFAGSFNYTENSNLYNAISIVTTTGSTRSGASYYFICGAPDIPACGDGFSPRPSNAAFQTTNAPDQTGLPTLFLNFGSPLNSLFGETKQIKTGDHFADEGTCENSACIVDGALPPTRFVTAATAASTEPLFESLFFGS